MILTMIKKLTKYLFVCLTIFTFQSVSAQNQVFHTGIQLGVNGTQIGGDDYAGFNKAGIFAGAYVNYLLADIWYMQFEINYSQAGSRNNNPKKGDLFLARLDYIQIPLSIGLKYSKVFSFEAGAYYGRLIHSYIENNRISVKRPYYPDLNDGDLGVLIGLFYNFNSKFMAHARFFTSVLPVWLRNTGSQNIGWVNKVSNRGWYNTSITLSLSYNINL